MANYKNLLGNLLQTIASNGLSENIIYHDAQGKKVLNIPPQIAKKLQKKDITKLFENLNNQKEIEALHITEININRLKENFTDGLKKNGTLSTLKLNTATPLKKETMYLLIQALENNSTISVLQLGLGKFPKGGGQYLANILSQTDSPLLALKLNGSRIDKKGIRCLTAALPSSTLTSLNLHGNKIGDKGVQRLSRAIEHNTRLKILNLSNNGIHTQGAKYLANALSKNETLDALILYDNHIQSQGSKHLAQLLKGSAITHLNIGKNSIYATGAKYLATPLRTNTKLTELILSHNKMTGKGVKYLATALEGNIRLILLNLDYNNIGLLGAKVLNKLLQLNTTLTILSAKDQQNSKKVSTKQVAHFAEALQSNIRLTTLKIGIFKNLEDQSVDCFTNALIKNDTLNTMDSDTFGSNHRNLLDKMFESNQKSDKEFFEACQNGDLRKVTALIEEHTTSPYACCSANKTDSHYLGAQYAGYTGLHLANLNGRKAVSAYLLKHYPNLAHYKDHTGKTAEMLLTQSQKSRNKKENTPIGASPLQKKARSTSITFFTNISSDIESASMAKSTDNQKNALDQNFSAT